MLRPLDENLWVIDLPFKMLGGIQIGTRTTVIRLADGALFMHCPGPIEEDDFQEIAKLGDVRHIVAANLFHNLYVKKTLARYEGATFYAPPDFEQKVPDATYETLTDQPPAAWVGDLDQIAIEGAPRLSEIVFVHRASRTLLLTDLCFNMQHSDSLITRIMMSMMGGYGHFGPSRLARSFMKDKAAVKAGVERILELDFDRVVVAHGEVLETGGREALRESFSKVG
jgi:hypothetical protein